MPKTFIDVEEIFDRIKQHLGVSGRGSDARLAEWFGKTQNIIVTWRNRNTLPADEILSKCVESGIDLNWLFTGENSPSGTYLVPETEKQQFSVNEISSDPIAQARLEGKMEAMEAELAWCRGHIEDLNKKLFQLQHPPGCRANSSNGSLSAFYQWWYIFVIGKYYGRDERERWGR